MKTVYFATSNPAKAAEAAKALEPFGVKVIHIKATKPEAQDQPIEKIAADGAKYLAKKLKKSIVVEDTGVFFDAYPGFPGPLAKQIVTHLKIRGILHLLRGKKRGAELRTAVAYCAPAGTPAVFIGSARGSIARSSKGTYHTSISYDVIFIPKGYTKTYAQIPAVKHVNSHRTLAFQKLGRWLARR